MKKNIALRFLLSKWFYIIFVSLSVVFALLVFIIVSPATFHDAVFWALGLMTGGGVGSLPSSVLANQYLTYLAWLIHIASWLFIPALVGILITDTIEKFQKINHITKIYYEMANRLGIPPDNQDEFVKVVDEWISDAMKGQSQGDLAR